MGFDLIEQFQQLFVAGRLPQPATWREMAPKHLSLMLKTLQNLHREMMRTQQVPETCLLPIHPSSWQLFQEGSLDQAGVAFMGTTLLEALGATLIGGAGRATCWSLGGPVRKSDLLEASYFLRYECEQFRSGIGQVGGALEYCRGSAAAAAGSRTADSPDGCVTTCWSME